MNIWPQKHAFDMTFFIRSRDFVSKTWISYKLFSGTNLGQFWAFWAFSMLAYGCTISSCRGTFHSISLPTTLPATLPISLPTTLPATLPSSHEPRVKSLGSCTCACTHTHTHILLFLLFQLLFSSRCLSRFKLSLPFRLQHRALLICFTNTCGSLAPLTHFNNTTRHDMRRWGAYSLVS